MERIETLKRVRLNARTAWRENLAVLEDVQKEIDFRVAAKLPIDEMLEERYTRTLYRVTLHWQRYQDASKALNREESGLYKYAVNNSTLGIYGE